MRMGHHRQQEHFCGCTWGRGGGCPTPCVVQRSRKLALDLQDSAVSGGLSGHRPPGVTSGTAVRKCWQQCGHPLGRLAMKRRQGRELGAVNELAEGPLRGSVGHVPETLGGPCREAEALPTRGIIRDKRLLLAVGEDRPQSPGGQLCWDRMERTGPLSSEGDTSAKWSE